MWLSVAGELFEMSMVLSRYVLAHFHISESKLPQKLSRLQNNETRSLCIVVEQLTDTLNPFTHFIAFGAGAKVLLGICKGEKSSYSESYCRYTPSRPRLVQPLRMR